MCTALPDRALTTKDSAGATSLGLAATGWDKEGCQVLAGWEVSVSSPAVFFLLQLGISRQLNASSKVMLARSKGMLGQKPPLECGGGEKMMKSWGENETPPPDPPCWVVVVSTQAVLDLQQQKHCQLCLHLIGGQKDVDDIHGQRLIIKENFCSSQATGFFVALPLLVENPPHCSFHLM